MQYAINFYQGCRVLDKADEIIIKYPKKNPELLHFIKKLKPEQRLIVNILDLDDIEDNLEIFKAAQKEHKNFALLTSKSDIDIINYSSENIKFFFIEGVDCLDEMVSQIRLGVSDIYVINELGFSITKIASLCHDLNIKIRVYPNVAQSRTELAIPSISKFFIRPDDVDLYEDYIDVFEFFGPLDKQPVLYDIYNDKKWLGNLDQVIIGLTKKTPNTAILPCFGTSRLTCQKRCSFNKCNICTTIGDIANEIDERGYEIRKNE